MSTQRRSLQLVLAMVLALATIVMGGFYRAAAAPSAQATTGYDLMLVLDRSGSIDVREFDLVKRFAQSVVLSCVFGADARAGVVQFGSEGTGTIVSGLSANGNAVAQSIGALQAEPRNATDIQEGILLARQELASNGRPNVERLTIVLTDGEQVPAGSGDPGAEADRARAEGIKVFAVGVGDAQNPAQLQAIASDPDATFLYSVSQFEQLRVTLQRLVPNACGPNTPVISVFEEPKDQPAEVSVVQRPNPNMTSGRNNIVTYTIVAKNHGKGDARNTFITMPFNKNEVKVLDAKFSRQSAWVSKLEEDHLEIRTGMLMGGGDVVTATVRLQTLASAPMAAGLGERLEYRWDDNMDDGNGRSNLTMLTVGADNSNQTYYSLTASPATAPAGTKVTFKGAAFAPNEPMTFWYNSPSKPGIGIGMERADQDGMATLVFDTAALPPGKYEMVAYGNWTEFTAVGFFEVTR